MKEPSKVVIILIFMSIASAAKLRSWLGPASFIEGDLPTARYAHGFVTTEGGKIFVFAGYGTLGNVEAPSTNQTDVAAILHSIPCHRYDLMVMS